MQLRPARPVRDGRARASGRRRWTPVPTLALLLAAGAASGCHLGSSSGDTDAAQTGSLSCLDVRNCIDTTCTGTGAEECTVRCVQMGTTVAQSLYRNLAACLVNNCCTDKGGCGGGDPRCALTGTPACTTCTCQAQCGGPAGSPCRNAATQCYGIEPDCVACPK